MSKEMSSYAEDPKTQKGKHTCKLLQNAFQSLYNHFIVSNSIISILLIPILDKTSGKQNVGTSHDSNSSIENSFETMKSGYFPKVNSINKNSDPNESRK